MVHASLRAHGHPRPRSGGADHRSLPRHVPQRRPQRRRDRREGRRLGPSPALVRDRQEGRKASTPSSTSPPSRPRSRSWTASSTSTRPSCAPRSCAPTCTRHAHLPAPAPATAGVTVSQTRSWKGERHGRRHVITVVGNLTADPELRFTPSGAAVANFTVASTPRTLDKTTNEWKDGEALFLRCSVWRQAAENVAESLHRGTRVIVQGRLKQRSYETKEGEKRTVYELEVDEIGPSLQYATAKVTKAHARRRRRRRRRLRRRRPGGRPVGQRPAPARRRRPRPTSPRSNDPSPLPERDSTTMAKPPPRKPKKKVCAFCKDKSPTSTTRTPACCASSSPTAARSAPAASAATARSTSATSPWPSRTAVRWRCCPTPARRADRGATMKLILTQDVTGLGAPGDVVEVAPTATAATTSSRRAWPSRPPGAPRSRSRRSGGPARSARSATSGTPRRSRRSSASLAVTLPARAGEGGRLFGSVTSADVVDAVQKARRPEARQAPRRARAPIKSLGTHTVHVKVHPEVDATVTLEVVAPEVAFAQPSTARLACRCGESGPSSRSAAPAARRHARPAPARSFHYRPHVSFRDTRCATRSVRGTRA